MPKNNALTIICICITLLIFNFLLASNIISQNYNLQNPKSISSLNEFRVIDGDTFQYNNSIIRLICVQTPEKGQEGYERSTSYLHSLLSQGQIIIKQQEGIDKDIYNRSLRFVYVNTTSELLFVNKMIIDNGFGSLFPFNNTNCSIIST